MKDEATKQGNNTPRLIKSVILFLVAYLAITSVVGIAVIITIISEVWQLTAW
jgi:hypothetical protein